jgi:hypothetical protein
MRHLSRQQAETQLRLGKQIEQWLGVRRDGDLDIYRWVTAHHDGRDFVVRLYEGVEEFDGTADENLTLLFSRESDRDGAALPILDAAIKSSHADAASAIDHVVNVLGGSADRFVNQSFVQDEYRDWKAAQSA